THRVHISSTGARLDGPREAGHDIGRNCIRNSPSMSRNPLFEPFAVKSLKLPNRIVMAPMTRSKSPSGIPGADVAAYYRRRAEGGVGLIVTEGTIVDRPGACASTDIPNFHAPESLAGWRKVVDAVHAAGGKIAPQLWHQGMVRKPGTGP